MLRCTQNILTSRLCCRICILAGDISPIDVITHIPVLCEENQIPYIYVPSKEVSCRPEKPLALLHCNEMRCIEHACGRFFSECSGADDNLVAPVEDLSQELSAHCECPVQALGAAGLTKRPTSILMVLPKLL